MIKYYPKLEEITDNWLTSKKVTKTDLHLTKADSGRAAN